MGNKAYSQKLNKRIKSVWTNINIRAANGLYRKERSDNKNNVYENINILFTRKEFKDWCFLNKDVILSLKRPSIDRINNKGHYSLDNIRFIELCENIRRKNLGNNYLNGKLSNNKRGITPRYGKFTAKITLNNKCKYLGNFSTKEKAYNAYKKAYFEHYGRLPWIEEEVTDGKKETTG